MVAVRRYDSLTSIQVILYAAFIPLVITGLFLLAVTIFASDALVDYDIEMLQRFRENISKYSSMLMGGTIVFGILTLATGICGIVAYSQWKFPPGRKIELIFIVLSVFQVILVGIGLACFFWIYFARMMQYTVDFCYSIGKICDANGFETEKCSMTEEQFDYWCLYRFPLVADLAMYATIAGSIVAFIGTFPLCCHTELIFRINQNNQANATAGSEMPTDMKSTPSA
eukprot:TRINITY_DN5245_c0_g1_i1.p1 TRINITY_DN5245_c0_g1~~TRINITY_DN5245_c0_g1_i1.p1  ORF type:complete len:227 (-),score=25.17 TRINITY_DN5245_c0_g1_i1:62-742(-)